MAAVRDRLIPVVGDDTGTPRRNGVGLGHVARTVADRDHSWLQPLGSEATCGEQRGTAAGRQRHVRAGEPMCGSCFGLDAADNELAAPPAVRQTDRIAGCVDLSRWRFG